MSTTTYRSPLLSPGEPLIATPFPKTYTLSDAFRVASQKYASQVCFRYRHPLKEHLDKDPDDSSKSLLTIEYEKKVHDMTYATVDVWMEQLAWGLRALDAASQYSLFKSRNIGMYLETSKEWIMMAQAAMRHGLSVVTCYANLGLDALVHVINETQMRCIIVERAFIPIMLQVQAQCKTLEMLIIVDRERKARRNEDGKTTLEGSSSLKGITFYNLRQMGKQNLKKKKKTDSLNSPNGNTTCVIMYTSGSTGNPKGVVVPHRALLAASAGMMNAISASSQDVYLGYLPLAHILELAAEHACLFSGATICYGNPRTLMAKPGGAKYIGDIELYKVTILCGVPRVFDTIRKGIMAKMGGSTLKQWLFQRAYQSAAQGLKKNGEPSPSFHWDALIFKKLRAALGGRVRLIVSGGAPLSAETHEFLRIAFGCDVIQGYGLTETCGGGTVQPLGKFKTRSIGHPIASCEIKLVDVPDMGYTSQDKPHPRGEIVIRGHNITNGYYKLPDKTHEVFIDDWFYTGDIGEVHEDGTISIIDRKKNLIKLSNGEYVALEALESLYGISRFVLPNGICVYGNSEKDYIVALVLLHPQYVKQWAKENGLEGKSLSALKDNDKLKKAVLNSFNEIAEKSKKKGFERLKDVSLLDEEWTVENGMLTNSMKLKRQDIVKKYQKNIDRMYGGGNPKIQSKL